MAEDLPGGPGEVLGSLARLEQAVTSIAGLAAAAVAITEGVQNVGILKDKYLKEQREEDRRKSESEREEERRKADEWYQAEIDSGTQFKNGPPPWRQQA